MASNISSVLTCFLLLLPYFGFSEHTSGRNHVLLHPSSFETRTQKTQSASMAATDCSLLSGPINDKTLPVAHPLSPCSHRSGARKDMSSVNDILHADKLRLRSLLETGARADFAASTSDSIPIIAGRDYNGFPRTLFYNVAVGYGTPAQQFTVAFDTAAGFSYLRCKPCKAGDSPCNQAFDPSLSSSFVTIPCGSPECPTTEYGSCSSSQTCQFRFPREANGTYIKDTLTLSPSAAVDGFTLACTESVDPELFYGADGMIDLSRNNNSLASRVVSSSSPSSNSGDATIAFSYCLPSNVSSHGFFSVGHSRSVYSGRQDLQYAPLVANTDMPTFYFVELVGIKVGDVDLQIPPGSAINNFTFLDSATTFTYFEPSVYSVLRREFRRQLAAYPTAPPFNGLDTCFNFTGLDTIFLPLVALEFAGGSILGLSLSQTMYFTNPANPFSVACLAFGWTDPENTFPISIIGNLVQKSTEMIYDLQGGKLGFARGVC